MRTLKRNKRKFYYAQYETKVPSINEDGHRTGEYEPLYSNPMETSANISAAKGELITRLFGESENYDKVIVLDNTTPTIDEYTRLWVDIKPKFDTTGALVKNLSNEIETPHDYIVKKVAKSINSTLVAISKVNVK